MHGAEDITSYAATGAVASLGGAILGLIEVSSLLNAFLVGAAGALGGIVVRWVLQQLKKAINKRNSK